MTNNTHSPHALALSCPPIPLVRIGLVGLGRRGMKTLERYVNIKGAEIRMLADVDEKKLNAANEALMRSGRPIAQTCLGTEGWKDICACADIDLLYICTDWSTHCEMAIEALNHGKHVAVEVPAATTVEECHRLVETAERTQRHLFMTENCCYDQFSISTYNILKEGLLGEITHCEGAYIHNLMDYFGEADEGKYGSYSWMTHNCSLHEGNPYPTHGMGPIGWLLNLHRGDRMDYLVSMTSETAMRGNTICKVNNTLIRTIKGKSILLQLDVTTPRPYNRLQTVCGTHGFLQKYPTPTLQLNSKETLQGEEAELKAKEFFKGEAARLWEEGHRTGVPNEMNYAMDSRLIHCLQQGLPLDIDAYDAAEWSCIAELSEISARNGSRPVSIPDFTRGRWDVLPPHPFVR